MEKTKSITEIKNELVREIEEAVAKEGGKTQLSVKLGKSSSYVGKILERQSFSGLQKLLKLIKNT